MLVRARAVTLGRAAGARYSSGQANAGEGAESESVCVANARANTRALGGQGSRLGKPGQP